MTAPQTTPLSELLGNDHPNINPAMQDPTAQYGQMPSFQQPMMPQQQQPYMMEKPVVMQQPTGPGQGVSAPDISGGVREFFGLKETDYKSIILVFSIILILSSGIFYSILRPYVPGAVGLDGKVTLIGSLIAATVGTLIYIAVKLIGKF